jgi:DhnA family fructose-bisphosphate aldolase class Ia
MPVMVEPTLFNTARTSSSELGDAVRVAFEIGADILKVPYPGSIDVLEHWVQSYPVPFLMLGGSTVASGDHIINLVQQALNVGVSGIVMGRNVWNRPGREGLDLMGSLLEVVHSSL